MNKFRKRLISFIFLLVCAIGFSSRGDCQTSDYQKLVDDIRSGKVDPSALTNEQKQLIGQRAPSSASGSQNGKDQNILMDEKKNSREKKDTAFKVAQTGLSINTTFGEGVFSAASVTDLTELSTPPSDYPIGVGDHVILSLWGGAELQENYVVGKDGSIFPKGLGKIQVSGLSFEEMKNVIINKIRSNTPSGTKIAVSLGQPRSINVNVVGNVVNPGPVTVSAFSNAFHVIAKAGGVTEYGDLRSIQIRRGGKLVDELDVYKYLTTGDFGKQIYLQNNDFIIVGFYQKKVLATGQFKRPMYYQLKKDEGIRALLEFSGGSRSDGYASIMQVVRTEQNHQVLRDIDFRLLDKDGQSDFVLLDGDMVKINPVRNGARNRVEIQGEVNYPGTYELKPSEKLFDLIDKAGGINENTYLQRAYVFKGAADSTNYKSERVEIDLSGFINRNPDDTFNIALKDYDIVQLFSKSEFGQQQFVEVFGEVRKPGKYKRYEKMTLQDLLYLSGGLTPSAEFGRLEVSSIVNMGDARKGIQPTKTIVKSYAIQPDLSIDSLASSVIIMPYDQVFVRKNPSFEYQQNIEIKGLVKYPGLYPRLNKLERISSFIERAGGLAENADITGAVLLRRKQTGLRESEFATPKIKVDSNGIVTKDSTQIKLSFKDEPVSIDLKKALENPNSRHDIVLQENDIVFIPEVNPFVNVVGKVQSSLKTPYDKNHRRLKFYIDKAGGYAVRPWRKRVYVTYANGKSKRTRNILFIHFYPKVAKGSIITVPARPEGQDMNDILKATISSVITVVTTAIIFKYVK